MTYYLTTEELYHHGILGQKWGKKNGPPYPLDERDHSSSEKKAGWKDSLDKRERTFSDVESMNIGKRNVDTYIDKNVNFYRIQKEPNFEKFPFYATYKQKDADFYTGMFGQNLINRGRHTNPGEEIKVYKLNLQSKQKIKIPSDINAANTMSDLMKDSTFKNNLRQSFLDSDAIMNRKSQNIIFKEAVNGQKTGIKFYR